MLLGLKAAKGSGKTTIANALVQKHNFIKVSFADPLKHIISYLFNIPPDILNNPELKEQVDDRYGISPRQALQTIGTDLFRVRLLEIHPTIGNIWLRKFEETVKQHQGKNIVVDDVRFSDEVKLLKSMGFQIIQIERDTQINTQINKEQMDTNENKSVITYTSNLTKGHISENDLNGQIFPVVKNNNSLDETIENIFSLISSKCHD